MRGTSGVWGRGLERRLHREPRSPVGVLPLCKDWRCAHRFNSGALMREAQGTVSSFTREEGVSPVYVIASTMTRFNYAPRKSAPASRAEILTDVSGGWPLSNKIVPPHFPPVLSADAKST